MTLEENIEQLRDSLVRANLAPRDPAEKHQQWLEQMARMAKLNEMHAEKMIEFDEKMTQVAAAQLVNEEGRADLKNTVKSFIEDLRRGGNTHQ